MRDFGLLRELVARERPPERTLPTVVANGFHGANNRFMADIARSLSLNEADTGAASVLFVHGACHGSWCWFSVVSRLTDAGINADSVELPLTSLHDDSKFVSGVLDSMDGPIILVGHSYGGAVITEAGLHPSVTRLVYIAALAIDEGEAARSAGSNDPDSAHVSYANGPDREAGPSLDDRGYFEVDHDRAAALFYNDCDQEQTLRAVSLLRPQRIDTLTQEPNVVAWRHKPSTYVVCANDKTVHPQLQRILARRCTEAVEWPTGHSPFLSQPQIVADLIIDLAG